MDTLASQPRSLAAAGLSLAGLLVITLGFGIASGNAHWPFWAGLWPSLAIAPILVLCAVHEHAGGPAFPPRVVFLLLCLAGLALVAGASAFTVDPSKLTIAQWLGSYVSPFLIYVGVQMTPFTRRLFAALWIAITVGALIVLFAGLVAYYIEWGVPTGLELLISRYDAVRMSGYMEATFGNTGNTAAYLALLIPPWFAFLIGRDSKAGPRWLYLLALIIGIAHLLIVESRTLFLVLIAVLPLLMYYCRLRFAVAIGAFIIVVGAVVLPVIDAGDRVLDLTVGAFEGSGGDQSVSERSDAMRIGFKLMLESPALGVGPGNSVKANVYTSAHQYWVNQGAEIGVLGLVLSFVLSMIVFWRFISYVTRRSSHTLADFRFPGIAGAAAYMLYGCFANMPLADSAVNAWIGLFAIMLALDDVCFTGSRADGSVAWAGGIA